MPELPLPTSLGFMPRAGHDDLLAELGWQHVVIYPVAGDASFRRYFRISHGDDSAILMDAPPQHEDTRPFVRMANHLRSLGFSAPKVLAQNTERGFLLLEDFGDSTFTRLLADGADADALYQLATDTLLALHQLPGEQAAPNWLAPYDNEKLLAEAALLPDWFMPAVGLNALLPQARAAHDAVWREAFAATASGPRTLVLRDFHVDNLLRVEGRKGIAACGLLDFQDAVAGHPAYDLMSLLEDARLDIAPQRQRAMLARYHAAQNTEDRDAFDAAYAVLGAGRHAKVIGIFTRLGVRDAKQGYLQHIPRVWRLLEHALEHPALSDVRAWFDAYLPATYRIQPTGGG